MKDGVPNFAAVDEAKRDKAIRGLLCGICGKALGLRYYFIGGPLSCQMGYFTDPAMHHVCAQYAMRVCPFITRKKAKYRELPKVYPEAGNERPEKMGLLEATSFFVVDRGLNYGMIRAYGTRVLEWEDGE